MNRLNGSIPIRHLFKNLTPVPQSAALELGHDRDNTARVLVHPAVMLVVRRVECQHRAQWRCKGWRHYTSKSHGLKCTGCAALPFSTHACTHEE